jgi:hypothetical protein
MHYNMKKPDYKYPDCLSNCKDLNLGKIYTRFRHIPNLPELTTIYEIEGSSQNLMSSEQNGYGWCNLSKNAKP